MFYRNSSLVLYKILFYVLLLLAINTTLLFSQTREQLEQERQRIEEEIHLTAHLLEETKKSAETNLNQLVILNNQIRQREELINNIGNRVSFMNRQIHNLTLETEDLNDDLEELKESYANMIYHAYKNRNAYHRLMFIFSAKDFNQAYTRMKYFQQYAHHRQLQADKIEETTNELSTQISELEKNRAELQELLISHRKEIDQLTVEKQEQNNTVEELRKREQELVNQLSQQQEEAKQLANQIQRIIEEERQRAAERAEAEGRATPTREFELTPDELIISDEFYENKGKLPWPSERGIITQHFGQQPHPVLSGINISSDGINISTTEGARARSIFEGTVVRVFNIPGGNNAVIVRHGEYLSVYSNLSEVLVNNGQKVNTRQAIGIISTDPRDRKTELHLQIWKGTDKLNPTSWIARKQ